jgi:hypothetical protein
VTTSRRRIRSAISLTALAATALAAATGSTAAAGEGETADPASLVRVSTPTHERKNDLTALGLDLTEHGGDGFVEVVLHGDADAQKLRENKFVFTTQVADLDARSARYRAADRRFAARVSTSALPSGRTKYRTLAEYNAEMDKLASENKGLVKAFELPFKTYEGRTVKGIEITRDVEARDGKPVFLQMGLHHAREWPSGEHAMEFAYELVNGSRPDDQGGSARVRDLLTKTRTIVVPVVNPDGFHHSRTRGTAAADTPGGGRGAPDPGEESETVNIVSNPTGEYRRKNCRLATNSESGNCDAAFAAGLAATGVDPNRNYGGLWGGPGASEDITAEDYRGPGPFSEPETRNIQDLVSKRHVTTLITNHTFSDLILRPPGIQSLGEPPDEHRGYKALSEAMAAENGYTSQKGFELYDTTGTTEDWTYPTTGGFGFTFEIGCVIPEEDDEGNMTGACTEGHFHPPFSEVVKEYAGETDRSDPVDEEGKVVRDGKGNREAYLIALESTANTQRHSVVDGRAPAGSVLRLRKSFKTKTSPVIVDGEETEVREFDDRLDTSMTVPATGSFEWHINPSTRPAVARATGRAPTGEPSPKVEEVDGSPAGAEPFPDANSDDEAHHNDHPFTVPPNGPGVDNAKFTARIEWTTITSDWDARLYKDTDGDGTVDSGEPQVGASQQGTTDFEQVTVSDENVPGALAGKYILRVNNFAAVEPYDGTVTFQGPDPFVPAQVESWTLTCESPEGTVRDTRSITIDRSQRQTLDLTGACASSRAAAAAAKRCVSTRGGVRARSVGPAVLARRRGTQRKRLGAPRLSARNGIDRYCMQGGGTMRVGYPTRRLNSKLSARTRKKLSDKAVFAVSTSKRFRIRKLAVGSRVSTLRKRLKGERSYVIGKNRWYVAAGSRSRLVFSTRRGRIREMGIASKSLSRTRTASVRLLRAWDRRG